MKPEPSLRQPASRFESLDYLRGLAALAVCLFHFTQGRSEMLEGTFLKALGAPGHWGAQAFFVISGFLIPAILGRKAGASPGFRVFLSRRLRRLYPPFLAALILALVLSAASTAAPSYQGQAWVFPTWDVLAANLTMTAGIWHREWLSPVFWTLGIELQFYLFIFATFWALDVRSRVSPAACFFAFVVLPILISAPFLVFHYLTYFGVGYVAMVLLTGRASPTWAWLALLVLAGATAAMIDGYQAALTIAVSLLIIIGLRDRQLPMLGWLGAISYSLYLTHEAIGRRVINIGLRWTQSTWAELLLLVIAIVASIAFAWLFWRWIERPALRWSHRLPKGHSKASKSPVTKSESSDHSAPETR